MHCWPICEFDSKQFRLHATMRVGSFSWCILRMPATCIGPQQRKGPGHLFSRKYCQGMQRFQNLWKVIPSWRKEKFEKNNLSYNCSVQPIFQIGLSLPPFRICDVSTGTTKNGSFRKWLSWIFCRDGQHRALGMIPPPSQQSPKIPSKDLNYIFRFFSSYGFTMKALAILDFNFLLHGLCYSMFLWVHQFNIYHAYDKCTCIFNSFAYFHFVFWI